MNLSDLLIALAIAQQSQKSMQMAHPLYEDTTSVGGGMSAGTGINGGSIGSQINPENNPWGGRTPMNGMTELWPDYDPGAGGSLFDNFGGTTSGGMTGSGIGNYTGPAPTPRLGATGVRTEPFGPDRIMPDIVRLIIASQNATPPGGVPPTRTLGVQPRLIQSPPNAPLAGLFGNSQAQQPTGGRVLNRRMFGGIF